MAGVPLLTLIMRRVASVGQKAVAEAIGVDDSTMSRMLSGERGIPIDKLEAMFTAIGMAGVEVGSQSVTVSREKYRATQLLAYEALQRELEGGE